MIREYPDRRSLRGSSFSKHLPLVALLAATSAAGVLACGNDDGGNDEATEAQALEPVDPTEVPDRGDPVTPPAPPPLPPGSDTLNGLSLPTNLANWRVIGVVNVPGDPGTVRVVVGNDIAVDAARSGQTNPWPDGTMMGHLQWNSGSEPASGTAVTPGDFARATVMVKDSDAYASDGGWAYGVWGGLDLVPPSDPAFDRACVNCHTAEVADKDYVFTTPGQFPSQAAIDAAPTLSNGLELPAEILNWSVIGIASRETDAQPSIRVIVGNDIAVIAARSGETNPWPDGAMLAHYSWVPGENPDAPDAVTPVSFAAFTLMVKDAGTYAEDGGWAYGAWSTLELTAPPASDFDRDCVDCHTSRVADSDYVFTRPGALPDLFTQTDPE